MYAFVVPNIYRWLAIYSLGGISPLNENKINSPIYIKMLAIFNSTVACGAEELRAAEKGNLDQPKIESASDLLGSFLDEFPHAVSVKMGEMASMAYTQDNQALLRPRSFAVKDDCFCLFEGTLQNLPSLRQQYGLAKSVNEVLLVIEAYRALRDRAPYPASHVVGHLDGRFAFVIFDKSNGTVFAATDSYGKVPFYWGIATDGCLAFSDDGQLLRKACGRSLASFPEGCFFSSTAGLRSYQHPRSKVMAIPNLADGEMCGTTFKTFCKVNGVKGIGLRYPNNYGKSLRMA